MNAPFDTAPIIGNAIGPDAVIQPAPDHQVAVIGLGYIGLPTAAVLASYGWNVCGVDVSEKVVETVNAGGVHIEERDLDRLVRERGMGLIFISHDLRLVSSFCDRVLVMYAGRVVEEVDAADLSRARHPYTRGLLSCLPRMGASTHPLPTLDRQAAWAQ